MNFLEKKSIQIGIILGVLLLIVIALFDSRLSIGLLFLFLLSIITLFFLSKLKEKSRIVHLLFLIILLIHLGAALFIHYANFQPFGRGVGDYLDYDYQAQEIAQRLLQGNFSLQGIRIGHYYPVIIGYIYALTIPEMLVGQLFGVWLAGISVLLVYLIVLEIGGTKKWAFLTGLIVGIYPSYLFYGSLLLKDVLVTPLILLGLFFCLKLIKNFSWKNFLIFYFALTAVIHFRFYVGFALLFTFIISWLVWGRIESKIDQSSNSLNTWEQAQKKLIYTIIIIALLGFSPQISGLGYYGIKPIKYYIAPDSITRFREVYYLPPKPVAMAPTAPGEKELPEEPISGLFFGKISTKSLAKRMIMRILPQVQERPKEEISTGSSIFIETGLEKPSSFIKNSLKSFTYVLLGPLPWQIRYYNQLSAFVETFPWYFLLFFIIKGAFMGLKRYRLGLPLLIFSIISLIVLSLFITNFGIATRIRIPSFIALLCLIPLAFLKNEK